VEAKRCTDVRYTGVSTEDLRKSILTYHEYV